MTLFLFIWKIRLDIPSFDRALYEYLTPDRFRFAEKVLLVITDSLANQQVVLTSIFTDCWSKSLLNINILFRHDSEMSLALATYLPFQNEYSCNFVKPIHMDVFNENKTHYTGDVTNLYPNKLANMYRCPMTVSVFSSDPFIILQNSYSSNLSVSGIDVQILKQLEQRLNFKLTFIEPFDKQSRGTIYPNWTATGSMKMVSLWQISLCCYYEY